MSMEGKEFNLFHMEYTKIENWEYITYYLIIFFWFIFMINMLSYSTHEDGSGNRILWLWPQGKLSLV
jgi:hypothetical protein